MSYGEAHWQWKQREVLPCVSVGGSMMYSHHRMVQQVFRGTGVKPPDSLVNADEHRLGGGISSNPGAHNRSTPIFCEPGVLRLPGRLSGRRIYNFKPGQPF